VSSVAVPAKAVTMRCANVRDRQGLKADGPAGNAGEPRCQRGTAKRLGTADIIGPAGELRASGCGDHQPGGIVMADPGHVQRVLVRVADHAVVNDVGPGPVA